MPKCFAIFLLSLSLITLQAQNTLVKKYKTGQIASKETEIKLNDKMPSYYKEVKVEVFNKKGEIVFTGYRRNYAGHSSVTLSYHENGGVKKIETSSAPDAGIQWYKSSYLLDEEGNIISQTEDGHDFHLKPIYTIITNPDNQKPEKEEDNQSKKVNACAVLMITQIIFYNQGKKPIEIYFMPKNSSDNKLNLFKIKPGDSLVMKENIQAEKFFTPEEMYELYVKTIKNKEALKIDFYRIATRYYLRSKQHKVYQMYWVD
jgi:hypothetical protein